MRSKAEQEKIVQRALADSPADPTPGRRILAVQLCSNVLEAHVWLALDPSFEPADGQAIYYAEELAILATKTPEQLQHINNIKLALGPGSRVME